MLVHLISHHPSLATTIYITRAMASKSGVVFEDFFPSMVERLGAEGFMDELCNGFRLLMDEEKGVITFESLKENSASVLGLKDMSNDELKCMLREGDLDGDECLNQMEFCVLMFRLSPELMKGSRRWIEEVVMNEM
ncbi:calcium-binding protein PBP1-like [Actinidia eriantha]|uniref:calcium-binding protein PBP1-like n=2 Tax=Actinidia eriantha TaxID=165200 RepID=UPI0025840EAC|nr:calcium-binding protein PBP1-like [Actinidia eriantha]